MLLADNCLQARVQLVPGRELIAPCSFRSCGRSCKFLRLGQQLEVPPHCGNDT
jgi:hypothetical protein